MTVGQHFAEYCDLIGLDKTSPAVADILAIATPVPAEFETKFKSAGLMTEAQAKQSPAVKSHFIKGALDAIDQDHFTAMDEWQLPEEAKAELKAEKNTYKRNALLRKKLKEVADLEVQKASATGTDKDKLVQKVKELNNEIVTIKETFKKEKDSILANEDGRMLDYAIRSTLASRKYPGDKIPHDVSVTTAYHLLNKALKEKNGKVTFADANKSAIKLVPADNPDLDYTVNNKTLPIDAFIEQTLADAGMTIVSNPKQNGNGSHHVDLNQLPENDRATAKQLLQHIEQM